MKKLAYLINTFFVIIFSKSGVFANELESEISYLLEVGKNNISQADRLVFLLTLLTGFFAVAFISIIGFIVFKLIDLSKQISANEKVLQTIKEHGESLTILTRETEEIRNQIRDQNLKARGITDEDYGRLLKDVLKVEPTPQNMNMVRNLVWTLFKPEEYETGLERLQETFSDPGIPDLIAKIKKAYFEKLKETIPQYKLLTWVYEIKENEKEMDDLIKQEIETRIRTEKSMIGFWKNLPPFDPERTLSHLEQIFKDLSKKKKSDE